MINPQYLQQRWVKILPHIIDSALLLSAIGLMIMLQQYPIAQSWLTAKIMAVIIYIGLGMVALRWAKTKSVKILAWLMGLVVLSYIVGVAMTHAVWPYSEWVS